MLSGAERRDAWYRSVRRGRAAAKTRRSLARWERERRDRGRWALVLTPGSVRVRTRNHVRREDGGLGRTAERGIVRGWSARSKRRFRMRMASIAWREGEYVFLTLTYPKEFPHDPLVWKRQLKTFMKAWARQYGQPRAVWVLEFQERGAPHFHIVFEAPPGVGRAIDDQLPHVRRWFAGTWHRIVTGCAGDHTDGTGLGPGCVPWHYERHLEGEHCKQATGARAAISYLERELGKEGQKTLPAYLDHQCDDACDQDLCSARRGAGRWWGVVGMEPDEQFETLTQREFVQLRHALLRLGRECLRRELAHRERIRLWKLSRGMPWRPRPRASGRWLSPRTINDGVAVMDPDLRPYSFARAFRALLEEIRRPAEVREWQRVGRDPIAPVLERLERSKPILFGWA